MLPLSSGFICHEDAVARRGAVTQTHIRGEGTDLRLGITWKLTLLLHGISILHNKKCFKFNTKTISELETINTPLRALILSRKQTEHHQSAHLII
jgi:hypothetical protein